MEGQLASQRRGGHQNSRRTPYAQPRRPSLIKVRGGDGKTGVQPTAVKIFIVLAGTQLGFSLPSTINVLTATNEYEIYPATRFQSRRPRLAVSGCGAPAGILYVLVRFLQNKRITLAVHVASLLWDEFAIAFYPECFLRLHACSPIVGSPKSREARSSSVEIPPSASVNVRVIAR